MNIIEYYQKMIESGEIISDPNQWVVASKLQTLYEKLTHRKTTKGLISQFKKWFKSADEIKGLYIWGSVGAGKTFLMNTFFL